MTWEEEYLVANRHFEKCICKILDSKESLNEKIIYLEDCYEEVVENHGSNGLGSSLNYHLINLIEPLLYELKRAQRIEKGEPKVKELIPTTVESFTENHIMLIDFSDTTTQTQQENNSKSIHSENDNKAVTDCIENQTVDTTFSQEQIHNYKLYEKKVNKLDPTFEEIFRSKDDSSIVIRILTNKGILDTDGKWQGLSPFKNEVIILLNALRNKGYLKINKSETLGRVLYNRFKLPCPCRKMFTISPKNDLIYEYEKILPEKNKR